MSKRSFGDCDAKRIQVRCLKSRRCVTVSTISTSGVKVEAYVKGCATTCSASDVPICNHPNVKCEVSCCSSDYCNSNMPSFPTTPPPHPITVASRKCYKCHSTHSFEDCDAKRVRISCLNFQSCVTASIMFSASGVKTQVYLKGCAVTCPASDIPVCKHPNVTCAVHCCSGDYCNGA